VRSWCTGDLLGLATYDRCNAQLEFLNGFDSALSFIAQVLLSNPLKCFAADHEHNGDFKEW